MFSWKYLHEEEMNCDIYTDKKALYRVKSHAYQKKSQLNLSGSLHKIVYIHWMSCFWTDDISPHRFAIEQFLSTSDIRDSAFENHIAQSKPNETPTGVQSNRTQSKNGGAKNEEWLGPAVLPYISCAIPRCAPGNATLTSTPNENMSYGKAISKTKSRTQSRAKDDQRAYDRRDSSFSVTPEVHSHLCGITETERQRPHHGLKKTFVYSKGSREKINLIWGNRYEGSKTRFWNPVPKQNLSEILKT